MKYLVFSDLDGTLLNKEGKLSAETKLFFEDFLNKGNTLVIATGRSYNGAIEIYNELNLKSFLICDNGGYILNPSDDSFTPIIKSMPLELFHELFIDIKDFVESSLFNLGKQVYSYKYIKEFEWLINGTTGENIIDIDFTELKVSPASLMLLVHNSSYQEFEELMNTKYKDTLLVRNWGSDRKYTIIEVYLTDSHKGAACQYVIDYLAYDKELTIAFGDGVNDIEMIRDSYHGVAMKNAFSCVKDVSKDQTSENNQHDGVVKYLKKYLNKD